MLGTLGLPVLAEDSLVVTLEDGAAWLWPGPAGVRLDPGTARALAAQLQDGPTVRGKRTHLPVDEAPPAPVPVAAIACLESRAGARVRLRRLDGPESLARLFPNVFGLDLDDRARPFTQAAELVRRTAVFAARMPDGLGRLPSAARRLAGEAVRAAETAPALRAA